jgi:hypothetical protein
MNFRLVYFLALSLDYERNSNDRKPLRTAETVPRVTETNLNLAITQAQQHAADATGAHFNLTTTQFAEVAAAHMALRRHVETITISTTESEERRQKLLQDFAEQMEANQSIWIAYHKDQAAKQEKFNSDCQ